MLFADTGKARPADLTEADLLRWCAGNGKRIANNSVHARARTVRSFLRWCARNGIDAPSPELLSGPDNPLRNYKRTYGKVQDTNPARWLSYEEAFTALVGTCQDGTVEGMRDEIVLRLGLAGMRATEIGSLVVGSLDLDATPPRINWTAKGSKPRTAVPGESLVRLLRRYLAAYRTGLRKAVPADAPLICKTRNGTWNGAPRLAWGNPYRRAHQAVWLRVTTRARAAGLGHVAPHDLRRTCAGLLHDAMTAEGGHLFDLRDIQEVMGHAYPETTARYLPPDRSVAIRAARVLD